MKPLNISHQARVWITYASFALIFFGFVFAQLYHSRRHLMATAEQALESNLMVSEQALIATVATIDSALLDIANEIGNDPKLMNAYPQRTVHRHQRALSEFARSEIRIIRANGDLALASDDLSRINFQEREYFQYLRDHDLNKLYISEPLRGIKRARWFVVFGRRISDAQGRFLGIVIVSMEPGIFERYQTMLKLGPDDLFTVVTGARKAYAYRSPKASEYIGLPFKANPVSQPVIDGLQHNGIYDIKMVSDGTRRISGVTWVGNYPMLVIIAKGHDAILAPWWKESLVYFGLFLLVISSGIFAVRAHLRASARILNQQAQLTSSAKLVALGEMAASVAHEINNPLAIIKARTEILKERLLESENTAVAALVPLRDLDRIDVTVDRISKIINGLRTFSRNAEGDPLVARGVRSILDDTFELCRERFKASNVQLRIEVETEAFVNCRPAQVSQVVLNLLNNAFDATETLPEKWVEVRAARVGKDILITVTDSGSGIPKDVADRMIEPFFSTKPVGKGTGLGLSISVGIIEQHGGTLSYDATSPHTCFQIRLPLQAERAVALAA